MFLPVEVSDLHDKPGVAAIETFFKLLIQSPGLRSIQENRLNTCLEKSNFLMLGDARGLNFLKFYTSSPTTVNSNNLDSNSSKQ